MKVLNDWEMDMKRDMDFVREILRDIEATFDNRPNTLQDYRPAGRTREEVDYHLKIMAEAGLIDIDHYPYTGSDSAYGVYGLTWEGHEFLDQIRDDSVWKQVKTEVLDKTKSISFEGLKVALSSFIKFTIEQSN